MGTRHSLFLCCVFISNFISPSYCDEAYSYPRPPDRPSVSAGRSRTRPYALRCSRITIPNGSMVLKHRGRVAKFMCNSGFKLIGDNIATCHQRKWDTVPTCVENVQCPKEIPKVMNGRMIKYSYVYFKVICNDGYKLPDNVQSIYPCEEFFRPDVKPPVCQLTDAMYCDFEKNTCGWNNTIPYFSWIRYQNATPSHELHTGPGGDHTTGTGHYLYIEASGLPDHEERYAKLTQFFRQVDTPEVCFVFWYHMYGYSIGTLDVYVDFNKVFSKSGNLGDKWRKGIVQRLPSDRDFYISVMATTANGFAGDIAIDDIGLVNSTDCTKTILIDATCKNRCFERELNPKLCKCSSECLIEGTCCTDFMHFCSSDGYTSTATAETTEWEATTEGWQILSSEGIQSALEDHSSATESAFNDEGSTEFFAESTSAQDLSSFDYQSTKESGSNGGLTTELQENTEVTSQDYVTASGSTRESDFTVSVEYSDSSKWLPSTRKESNNASELRPLTQQELPEVSSLRPLTEQEPSGVSSRWPSTDQEPHGVRKQWPSTQHEVGNKWSSTEQEPHASGKRWPSTHQEMHVFSKIWPSPQHKPLEVSKKWSSTQPEPQDDVGRWPSTLQEPRATISSTEPSSTPRHAKAYTKEPVIYSEHSYSPSFVLKETSRSVLDSEGMAGTSMSLLTKAKPRSEDSPQTTPITASPSHTERKLMSITHAKTIVPSRLPATIPKLTLTSETPPITSPMTILQQKSTSASSVTPTMNHNQANGPSSTVSHTHLVQENDYDELDESTTHAATQQPDRRTLLDLETTPSAAWVGQQKTRKPYKWKKTYEPKGRYTFSAVKSESKTTTYVSILVGVTVCLTAVVVAAYIFRRRRAIRFRDATEESDVLYMTSDEILDFSVARRSTPGPGHPGQPNPGPASSQPATRVCQSDFSFCSSNKS